MALSLYGLIRPTTRVVFAFDVEPYNHVNSGQNTVLFSGAGYVVDLTPHQNVNDGQFSDTFKTGTDFTPARILGRKRVITNKDLVSDFTQNVIPYSQVRNGSFASGGQATVYELDLSVGLSFTFSYTITADHIEDVSSYQRVMQGQQTVLSLDDAEVQLALPYQQVRQGQATELTGTFTQEFFVTSHKRVYEGQDTVLISSGAEQNAIPYNRVNQGQVTDQVAVQLWTDVTDDNQPEQDDNPWIQI